ncbi:hypothetical protein C8Q75DRAFT_809048 [Abortiporus biennis]|nr:hypothetical protein C8Q75DRAFT_809048 [Abortiporus biennis]
MAAGQRPRLSLHIGHQFFRMSTFATPPNTPMSSRTFTQASANQQINYEQQRFDVAGRISFAQTTREDITSTVPFRYPIVEDNYFVQSTESFNSLGTASSADTVLGDDTNYDSESASYNTELTIPTPRASTSASSPADSPDESPSDTPSEDDRDVVDVTVFNKGTHIVTRTIIRPLKNSKTFVLPTISSILTSPPSRSSTPLSTGSRAASPAPSISRPTSPFFEGIKSIFTDGETSKEQSFEEDLDYREEKWLNEKLGEGKMTIYVTHGPTIVQNHSPRRLPIYEAFGRGLLTPPDQPRRRVFTPPPKNYGDGY